MPRTAEQNEQIRAATRAAILDSAMRLFAQKGYAHTTTRSIAAQTGISSGLMYHYFSSKEALLQAAFDSVMARLSRAFTAVFDQSRPGEVLPNLLRTIFTLLQSDQEFWALFYTLRTQPAIQTILGEAFRSWTARLRQIFCAELAAAARPEPELDAYLLYSLVEGTIQQYQLDPENYPLDQVVSRIIWQYGGPYEPVRS